MLLRRYVIELEGPDGLTNGGYLADAFGAELAASAATVGARMGCRATVNRGDDPARPEEPRGDPPMGYGYRQLHVDPAQCYALRWGQSGRITGVYGPVLASCAHDGTDPAIIPYDAPPGGIGRRQTVEWANSQRWEVVR